MTEEKNLTTPSIVGPPQYQPFSEFIIEGTKYLVKSYISQGCNGAVYNVEALDSTNLDKIPLVVKKGTGLDLINEAKINKILYGIGQYTEEPPLLLMRKLPGHPLENHIFTSKAELLETYINNLYTYKVLLQKGIYHYDIAPKNILIHKRRLYPIDFDSSDIQPLEKEEARKKVLKDLGILGQGLYYQAIATLDRQLGVSVSWGRYLKIYNSEVAHKNSQRLLGFSREEFQSILDALKNQGLDEAIEQATTLYQRCYSCSPTIYEPPFLSMSEDRQTNLKLEEKSLSHLNNQPQV